VWFPPDYTTNSSPQTPHGHITAFCITVCRSPLIITLVLFIFTLMPLFSTLSFHSLSLLIRSSSVSAITTRSSVYNNSHGKATLIYLDKASMTITNSKRLNAEPWCIATFTSNCYSYHKLFLQLSLHQHIDITANINHSSTSNLCIAYLITSLRTRQKAFSKSRSGSTAFINPNCISSISICCWILCSKILSTTFVACSNNLIPE